MEEKIAVNTLQYLYKLDSYLANTPGMQIGLRQAYLQKAKILELRANVNLPKNITKPRVKCPKCCIPRSKGSSEYRLCRDLRESRFLRRLKHNQGSRNLTKYQQKFLKKTKDKLDQVLIITCKLCNHKVAEAIRKPEFIKQEKTSNIETSTQEHMLHTAKGKSKSKKGDTKNIKNMKAQKKESMSRIVPVTKLQTVHKNQGFQNNKKKQNKIKSLLNSSCKVKSTNLRDFIKSVT